jgi:Tol biopolymer transport system component
MRGTSSRLTFGGLNRTPIWSRDGKQLYFVTYDAAKNLSGIMTRAADGSGETQRLRDLPGQAYLEDLSPDGSTLLLSSTGTMWNSRGVPQSAADKADNSRVASAPNTLVTGRAAIYRVSVTRSDAEPEVAAVDAYNAAVSPNGRWLAYVTRENGRDDIFVQSFGSSGGRVQVSTTGGVEPRWAPDSRALYYLQNDQLVTVPIEPGDAFVSGRPRVLFGDVAQVLTDSVETYNIAPAGDRFVMLRPADDRATMAEVRVDLNWFDDLRRLIVR